MDGELRELERRVRSPAHTKDDIERLFALRARIGRPCRVRWNDPLTAAQSAAVDEVVYKQGRFDSMTRYESEFDGATIEKRAEVVLKVVDDAGVPLWPGLLSIVLGHLTPGSGTAKVYPKKLWAILMAEMLNRSEETPDQEEWFRFMADALYYCGPRIGLRVLRESKFSHMVPNDLAARLSK